MDEVVLVNISAMEVDDEIVREAETSHEHFLEEHPLPRDHSYLLGSSHPLSVSPSRLSSRLEGAADTDEAPPSIQRSSSPPKDGLIEIAILELAGVVLFPGSTIPVKLRDRSLITYLGHQIEVCRTLPHLQPRVQLGILTLQDASRHRYSGRIGTIATIQYTHEHLDDHDDLVPPSNNVGSTAGRSSHVWRRYQELDELVFTAVATGRFEFAASSATSTLGNNRRVFRVRELRDSPMVRPPMLGNGRLFATRPTVDKVGKGDKSKNEKDSSWKLQRHDDVCWNLSLITPTPHFIYQHHWPWKVVDELVELLQDSDCQSDEGCANLPSLGNTCRSVYESPTKFSFWMASNMPFTEKERTNLLEMQSTLERLLTIRDRVRLLVKERQTCNLGCALCEISLSTVTSVFQFEGAEGATSNYVNDHGHIHQITTLRQVLDERRLFYEGPPSTENSYFPGWSWTITYCRGCASLLGWKFQRVVEPAAPGPPNESRPGVFFGFQSSSVKTVR